MAKKEFGLRVAFKPVIKPLIASLIMATILLYSLTFIEDMTFILGLGEVIFGVLVYFAVMFVIRGIKKEDTSLLKILFKR